MDYLMIKKRELEALVGLPHIQQSAYIFGIRPYMDNRTLIVGIKRRISHQSISEVLYIEPHSGIQSGSPSRQQTRRIVKSLERAGLIEIQSDFKHLILKCVLAIGTNSVQNKADTKPTHYEDINIDTTTHENIGLTNSSFNKANIDKTNQADTPLKENNYIYLLSQFEKFWSLYPVKKSKDRTFQSFTLLNPDEGLLKKIMQSLAEQIKHHDEKKLRGIWVPPWKYPVNWLGQRCWEDEVTQDEIKERKHATSKGTDGKKPTDDFFWIPDEDDDKQSDSNVIAFPQCR